MKSQEDLNRLADHLAGLSPLVEKIEFIPKKVFSLDQYAVRILWKDGTNSNGGWLFGEKEIDNLQNDDAARELIDYTRHMIVQKDKGEMKLSFWPVE